MCPKASPTRWNTPAVTSWRSSWPKDSMLDRRPSKVRP